MKKLVLSALAFVSLSALAIPAASAADMPRRAQPTPNYTEYQPAFSWTGFYLGAQAGYSSGNEKVSSSPYAYEFGNTSFKGGEVGLYGNAKYQMGNIVFGLFADYNKSWQKGQTMNAYCAYYCDGVCVDTMTDTHKVSLLGYGTVQGQVGYAFGHTLVSVGGGGAYGWMRGVNTSTYNSTSWGSSTYSSTKDNAAVGWAVSASLEHAFTDHLIAGIDVTRVDLGLFNSKDTYSTFAVREVDTSVKARIGYKF